MVVTNFPKAVRVIEHTLIPVKDGTMLAARIRLPEDAEQNPVPAILEYHPYRKRDGTHERDALTHPYLAGRGYAGVRVDLRGSGESTGLLFDEYAKQEQDDGMEVIAWLAAQLWFNGSVGMMGTSCGPLCCTTTGQRCFVPGIASVVARAQAVDFSGLGAERSLVHRSSSGGIRARYSGCRNPPAHAGHFALDEKNDEIANLILAFLAKHSV